MKPFAEGLPEGFPNYPSPFTLHPSPLNLSNSPIPKSLLTYRAGEQRIGDW